MTMTIMTDIVGNLPLSASVLLLAVLVLVSYHFVVYPAFISPLSKIPNAHWSVPISPLWILYQRFRSRENGALQEAHRRLGPFIRVSPNDVNVDDLDAVRTIYLGGFERPEWYAVFDNYGVPCMFSARGSRDHSLRKRMISNVYSKSYIQSSPTLHAQASTILYDRFFPALDKSVTEQGLDAYSLFLATSMDLISAYIWGISRSTNFIQNKAYREHWLELYKSRNDYSYFGQELPKLTAFCKKLGIHLCPTWVDTANKELAVSNTIACERTLEHLAMVGNVKDIADDPVVMGALLNGIGKEETHGEKSLLYNTVILQRDLSIKSELWDHVLAGQETSGLALTYLTWRLCQDLDLQNKLREELLTLQPSMRLDPGARPLPDPKMLDSLPLLHAIVMETLRLHAPIPGPQPRKVPFPSAKIGPYTVPGGVRIAAMAHSLHRNDGVFPEADKWKPMRWLDADEEQKKEMNRQWWGFSSGGRMCIGSNFAMNEIKLITAAIYSNYITHIVDDSGIEQGDGYTGRPLSEQLWLRLEKAP